MSASTGGALVGKECLRSQEGRSVSKRDGVRLEGVSGERECHYGGEYDSMYRGSDCHEGVPVWGETTS